MVEIAALFFVFAVSVAVAIGAAFVVLGVLLKMMTPTAVRPSRGALGSVQISTLDASGQRGARYPVANHGGAASLVIRGAG